MSNQLSHIDDKNNPTMVDVSDKKETTRMAHARGEVILPPLVAKELIDGEIQSKKGPVFHTAIIAGTQAVKQTSQLIPFCHPLPIESCKINITPREGNKLIIDCKVKMTGKTGVEMEALTGVHITALTIYDMIKAISHDTLISNIHLVEKTGGKSDYRQEGNNE